MMQNKQTAYSLRDKYRLTVTKLILLMFELGEIRMEYMNDESIF
jgi:hypothetical protein